jgi:dienelactone hydrolase
VSKLHPLSRHFCVLWLAVVACGLLALPSLSHSQQTSKEQQISELEKQLADLQKKLEELKRGGTDAKAPRPIAMADILSWRSIHGVALSPDGQWFAHRTGPADGNDELIIHQTKGDKEYRFLAGSTGGGTQLYSHDSKWLAFTTNAPRAGSGPPGQPPAGGKKTILLNLENGKQVEFQNVRRFGFSGETVTHLALHKTFAPAAAPAAGGKGPAGGGQPAAPAAPASTGTDLVLYELATGNELTLGNVADYVFDKKGQWLAMTIDAHDQSNNALQLRNMATAALSSLDSGKASYQALAWTEKGDGLIVLKGIEDKAYEGKIYSIVGFRDFTNGTPTKIVYEPQSDSSFPKGMAISSNRAPNWTEDFSAVVFGISQLKKKDDKAPSKTEPAAVAEAPVKGGGKGGGKKGGKGGGLPPGSANDKPDLVIWHWGDERLQSQQQVQAGQDKNLNYLCVYRPADKKFVRLADEKLRQVTLAPKGRWAIGQDTKPYQLMSSLDGRNYHDIYVIDAKTGSKQKALTKNRWYSGPSPDGTHFLYYDDGHFFTYEMGTGKTHSITGSTPVSFVNDDDDHNVVKPPAKTMGWSKDGAFVLLSDNWDIWKLPVHGGPGVNLTGDGKKEAIHYRARLSLNPEEKGIDFSAPLCVSLQAEWTKKAGIGRIDPGKPGTVTKLLWDDAEFGAVQKAKSGDVIVYTRETHKDYPDYYVTDSTFQNGKKLTNGQPEQDKFLWSAGARLIDYTSAKGDKLQGALFLPANYEKGKSYPTIVYIYEKLSNGLNKYQAPTANGFNKSVYTSNGYAVLMPDIKYTINDPGRSAVWCVLPALEAAVATGVVDKNKVGIHGHSWGGYQTAFLITQTDAFKAAIAGAPLTDMVSMYSSIYWNTGSANQPIFESSQGRFTGGYWDDMDSYIRNSPVYHAKNVKTPLIILHNDKDGAVDWNQGIEYFNTLRRLQKPVVLLQYKGENHGLAKPANKKDYTIRMKEFFDHHLMGKPAPAWLQDGVPHLKLDEHIAERMKG